MRPVDEVDENLPIDKDSSGVSTSATATRKRIAHITVADLHQFIKEVEDHPIILGEKWYVVSQSWWKKLLEAAKQGFPEDIKPINNVSISEKSGRQYYLKTGLAEGSDFMLIPHHVFSELSDVYGLVDEGRDVIERIVVEKSDKLIVEVYPRIVTVSLARDSLRSCDLRLNGDDTMTTLRDRALHDLNLTTVPANSMRFYIKHADKYELVDTVSQDLNSYFDTAQKVVVDIQDDEGNWFINNGSDHKPRSLFSTSSSQYYETRETGSYIKGACGLQNLGNTCFMASAIQCLSNVPPLTQYFLTDEYMRDINERNPLGTKGELARAYGELMHSMWSGNNSSVVPRKLKMTIGQFAPRFSGYSQQDSQELLAYLLDGLHEDLNRIKTKPYVQEDETVDKLEEHLQAQRAWDMYKARNDSIVVDKVHGQLKSTLVCPVCDTISIKFDPFCFLSVPLPPKDTPVKLSVTLIYNTKKRWAKFSILVTRASTVSDVMSIIRANLGPDSVNLQMVMFMTGDVSDDVYILNPSEPVHTERERPREMYAAVVQHSPATSPLVIVKNMTQTGRSLSIPMIFTVPTTDHLTRGFLTDTVQKFIVDTYMNQNSSSTMEIADDDDDSMTGEDNRDPYKLFIRQGENYMPFPATGRDDPIAWPDNRLICISFQWKDGSKLFNGYKGNDLIDREYSHTSKKEIHLMECIDLFTKQEQLGEEDSWYCPKCKRHERASKKLDLWKLPEILIVHLKRFQYTRWSREKIDIPVIIPVKEFELNSKLANEKHEHVKYDLIAISQHMGGLGGGHYSAQALNITTGKWFDFNDSCVSETAPPNEPITSRSPYMLVYRQRIVETPSDANMEMETDG